LWIFHSEFNELIVFDIIDYQEVKIQLKCDLTKKTKMQECHLCFLCFSNKKSSPENLIMPAFFVEMKWVLTFSI